MNKKMNRIFALTSMLLASSINANNDKELKVTSLLEKKSPVISITVLSLKNGERIERQLNYIPHSKYKEGKTLFQAENICRNDLKNILFEDSFNSKKVFLSCMSQYSQENNEFKVATTKIPNCKDQYVTWGKTNDIHNCRALVKNSYKHGIEKQVYDEKGESMGTAIFLCNSGKWELINGHCKQDKSQVDTPKVVNCQGHWTDITSWSACNNTTNTSEKVWKFIIDQHAKWGGDECSTKGGTIITEQQGCAACEGHWFDNGNWSACINGKITKIDEFKVDKKEINNGKKCSYKDGQTKSKIESCQNCDGYWVSGKWTTCRNNTQSKTDTFKITKNNINGGNECPEPRTQTQSCRYCTGYWGPIKRTEYYYRGRKYASYWKIYYITRHGSGVGTDCPYSHGYKKTISSGPVVNCVGDWGDTNIQIGNRWRVTSRTYHVEIPAQMGGRECPYRDGYTQTDRVRRDNR